MKDCTKNFASQYVSKVDDLRSQRVKFIQYTGGLEIFGQEIFGQRWKYSDSVGNIQTTFSP